MDYFTESLQHLMAELERVDLLIQTQVAHARRIRSSDEQFLGLYISEQELDALLAQPKGQPYWLMGSSAANYPNVTLDHLNQEVERRKVESLKQGVKLRLHWLQELFDLSPLDRNALLVALAVELDLRYERLYAYLQDDVTKKRPSVDLTLNLLAPSSDARITARQRFMDSAPLLRCRLLELVEDPAQSKPPLLAKYLKVDDHIVQYLLGSDELDARLQNYTTLRDPQKQIDDLLVHDQNNEQLERYVQDAETTEQIIVHLRGPYGIGKQETAAKLCRQQGVVLMVVDLDRMVYDEGSNFEQALYLLQREAKLQNAALYWKHFDILFNEKNNDLFKTFLGRLVDRPALTFLAGAHPWEPSEGLRAATFVQVELSKPTSAERSLIWGTILNAKREPDTVLDLGALASKFKFTAGQIQDAAATAKNLSRLRGSASAEITMDDLYQASRLHSNQRLTTLARKIVPKYQWEDIVLPNGHLEQLREICNHVKFRHRVYGDWGFDRKLSYGKGLSVLFSGPSGTGKTMAAEIIAGELGLELYKIDLSTVVSKYIGETEKNLSQIFKEAETSNAILFFDEADALFGKRSEIKDAHDRYANIETGYLLQRLEEYEGVVILASNFRKNIDDSFVRRLQFTVEFPFPDAMDRKRIWEGIWPSDTPKDPILDFSFLAERFELSGGNIRNIALSAAFIAADDGNTVEIPHLLRATKREYQKMGKVISQGEFEEFGIMDESVKISAH